VSGYVYPQRNTDGSFSWVRAGLTTPFTAPPSGPTTIFGYNSSDTEAEDKFRWWGKLPCGRHYYGTNPVPGDGKGFLKNGKEYKAAALHRLDVVSSKRLCTCVKVNPTQITSASSARVVELFNYCRSVPAGWTIYLTDHEYNSSIADGTYLTADYFRAFEIIGAEVERANILNLADGNKGKIIWVINASGFGILAANPDGTDIPPASMFPAGTQLWWDAYNSFSNAPPGFSKYKNYGIPYGNAGTGFLTDLYQIIVDKGYATPTYGWGIGEFNSPRRVAPKLATLDNRLGWGPDSPNDFFGAGQAAAIQEYVEFCLSRPVKPKVILLWAVASGTKANQSLQLGGSPVYDDVVAGVNGTHYQQWPIDVPKDLPVAVWQSYLDQSL
jgi:hypothetical protein